MKEKSIQMFIMCYKFHFICLSVVLIDTVFLTLIWVGYLGTLFMVGIKLTPSSV